MCMVSVPLSSVFTVMVEVAVSLLCKKIVCMLQMIPCNAGPSMIVTSVVLFESAR